MHLHILVELASFETLQFLAYILVKMMCILRHLNNKNNLVPCFISIRDHSKNFTYYGRSYTFSYYFVSFAHITNNNVCVLEAHWLIN